MKEIHQNVYNKEIINKIIEDVINYYHFKMIVDKIYNIFLDIKEKVLIIVDNKIHMEVKN